MSYDAELYMHDLDRKAFAALNNFPKFLKLQQAFLANSDEKAMKIQFLSTGIRLSEKQMSEIYNLLPPICNKLGISIPELYLVKSRDKKDVNAFTAGITEPFICLTSELVKQFSPETISSVIAHECGHIACKHYLYHTLAINFADGIASSPLNKIPGIKKYLTNTLVTALKFWDRCSELSADRAAVLCDGNSEKTVDMLLKIHGFEDNINREEFMKQALDLKAFVNDSPENKMMEQIITQGNTHPLLATRAYECYDFAHSIRYKEILNGTFTLQDLHNEENKTEEIEVVNADVSVNVKNSKTIDSKTISLQEQIALDNRLKEINNELEKYTCHADKADYAYAIACGVVSGAIDSVFFADTKIIDNYISLSHRQVNAFIQGYAKFRGIGDDRLNVAIKNLEEEFVVLQDNLFKGKVAGVTPKNHHLADLAHHPTPVGLMAALIVQFLRVGIFVNKNGEWSFQFVRTTKEDIFNIAVPAVITGFSNWLVNIAENNIEDSDEEIPKAIKNLAHVISSTPILIEIIKCTDNWFGHLVSDMGGSKNTAGGGMGIPGVFISLLHEISALPILKDTELPQLINHLYEKEKIDLRHEFAGIKFLEDQAIPVIFNEITVRLGYMFIHLGTELLENKGIKGVNWHNIIPFGNRTVERMITISSMTFNVADTADAAIRAAVESGGSWIVFSYKFVTRYNYVGAGRAVLAIVKEVSNENKETQLIHERMILMNAKSQIMYEQLQEFKTKLEEKMANYIAEDIATFIEAFDYINEGLTTGDSNLVIKGNVVIQKVLGRQPQFTTQDEFDDLMESDIPLEF